MWMALQSVWIVILVIWKLLSSSASLVTGMVDQFKLADFLFAWLGMPDFCICCAECRCRCCKETNGLFSWASIHPPRSQQVGVSSSPWTMLPCITTFKIITLLMCGVQVWRRCPCFVQIDQRDKAWCGRGCRSWWVWVQGSSWSFSFQPPGHPLSFQRWVPLGKPQW